MVAQFKKIKDLIDQNSVVLFMKGSRDQPKCGFSAMVVQALGALGVEDFHCVDVLEDSQMRQDVKDFADWPTLPQLYVKGEFVGGADIVQDMLRSGKLKSLMLKHGVIEPVSSLDHKALGMAMDLFHFQDEAAGIPFWHANGWALYKIIKDYLRRRLDAAGYEEVNTPQLVSKDLWRKSGHLDKFGGNMYSVEATDGREFAIKPMNCPCHVQIFNSAVRSYRDLPMRISEFGICHRAEPSGALNGLFRGRAFVQDDAHMFCTKEQMKDETVNFCHLLDIVYKDFGFDSYKVKFADRPEVRVGHDSVWDRAESDLQEAMKSAGLEWEVNRGEGAFYGPKIEFILTDSIGRDWQCGTLQLDFILPEKLGAEFINQNGEGENPVLIHRAVFGSFERFIGILLEHYDGNLPMWLAPVQVALCPISDKNNSYAEEVSAMMKEKSIRVKKDFRNTTLQDKIRNNSMAKVPVLCIIGDREEQKRTVSLKLTKTGEIINGSMVELIDDLLKRVVVPF